MPSLYSVTKDRVLSSLGWPTVKLEEKEYGTIEKILRDAIEDALEFIALYKPSVELHKIKALAHSRIELPPNKRSKDILDVIHPKEFFSQGFMRAGVRAALATALTPYTVFESYAAFVSAMRTIKQYTGSMVTWFEEWEKNEKTGEMKVYLRIHPPVEVGDEVLVAFRYIPDLDEDVSKVRLNAPEREWVRRWAAARVKEHIGRVRSKYGGTVPLGAFDITLDGPTLLEEAKTELEALKAEIIRLSASTLVRVG